MRKSVMLFCALILGAIVGAILGMGTFAYPPPNSDYGFFVVPATLWAKKNQLSAPSFPVIYQFDAEGRLAYNGFLFPLVIGESMKLLKWTDGAGALMCTDLFSAVAVLIWGVIIFNRARGERYGGALFIPFFLTSSLALASVYMNNYGRPESLSASLLLILGWLHLRAADGVPSAWLCAIIVALIFCTSPAAGVIAAELSGCWVIYIYGLNRKSLWWGIFFSICVTLSIFSTVALLYPYPSKIWYWGIYRMLQGASSAGMKDALDWNLLSSLLIWKNHWPGLGVLVGLSCATLPVALWLKRDRPATWLIFLPLATFCLYAFIRATIGSPWTYYRLFSVLPCTLLLLFEFIQKKAGHLILFRKILALLLCISLGFISSGAIRSCADFVDFLVSGVRLEAARRDFAKLFLGDNGTIGISNTLIPLTENFENVRLIAPIGDVQYPVDHQITINTMVVQADTCSAAEDILPKVGFKKTLDHTLTSTMLWRGGGFFGGEIPTYGFCVYRRLVPIDRPDSTFFDRP